MKRWILTLIVLLWFSFGWATETCRWNKVVNEDSTASTYTSKCDVDSNGDDAGETRGYKLWIICNNDTTDVLYVDLNSDGSGTQNTAVNDGSRSTSTPIFAGTCHTFKLISTRSTVSMICTAGQTCSNAAIYAGEAL